jgi:hypothetical protein
MTQYLLKTIIPALLIIGCRDNQDKIHDNSGSSVTVNSLNDMNKTYKNIHIMAKPDSLQ